MKIILPILVFFVSFIQVTIASAQVEITEIMYDLEGGDSGLEWVEIHNAGDSSTNLSGWRLFEADTNHKLTILSGDGILGSGEYGLIIADVNPGFYGDVFDTTFSLSNTGETIVLRNEELVDISTVSYSSDWGAAGDGNSLQKINGVWKPASPTPGVQNNTQRTSTQKQGVDTSGDTSDTHNQTDDVTVETKPVRAPEPERRMIVSAGPSEMFGVAGTHVKLEGNAVNEYGYTMTTARYFWNFGDGSQGEGKNIKHVYLYPGEYMAVLSVTSGGYEGTEKVKVIVEQADIVISKVGTRNEPYIELQNNTSHELDLSGWKLSTTESEFVFPSSTFMFPGKTIVLAQNITGLAYTQEIRLLYPDERVAYIYSAQDSTDTAEEIVFVQTPTKRVITPVGNLSALPVVVKSEAVGVKPSASLIKEENDGVDTQTVGDAPVGNEETKDILQGNLTQLAASSQKSENDDGLLWGLMGVGLLVLIAIYAVLDRKPDSDDIGIKSEADLYKIIEIDD